MNICICTICKNESKHVKRWVNSCKEADSFAILDTGSTDNTVELFKKEGIEVHQKTYEKFRWDVARNDSMKYIPSDADIILFVDLDETLDAGWHKIIDDNWILGKHTQAKYYLSQENPDSHLTNQINTWMIENSPKWYWRYPIYEDLWRDDINQITSDNILDIVDKFTVHHNPDTSKSRSWYNPLLEERLDEYPNQMSRYYYGVWMIKDKDTYIKGVNELLKIINAPNDHTITSYERADAARLVAIAFYNKKDFVNAENVFKRGLQISPTFSGLYTEYAKFCFMLKRKKDALALLDKALEYNDYGGKFFPEFVEQIKAFKEYINQN